LEPRGSGIQSYRFSNHRRNDPDHVLTGEAEDRNCRGSHALRADAIESITWGWLSFVVLVGLLAQLALGAWWIDSITSLAIVYFVVKEGREAWAAEGGGSSSCH
jgi:hypothetical protein